MKRVLARFSADDGGFISVDWLILATGVIALSAGSLTIIFDDPTPLAAEPHQTAKQTALLNSSVSN
ncbi:MAG: hypothetical protein AAF841_10395 [Pseudomonadota bacterium]